MSDLTYNPDTTSPPGDTISDWMEEHGVSVNGMAWRCHVPTHIMQELCDGEREVDHAVAYALADVTQIPMEFWLERERRYRERIRKNGREEK